MASPPFILDLSPWRHDRLMLDVASLTCTQIAQDAIAREYHLEVPRLLTFLGAAMALTAQGLEPSDRAVLTDLADVRENELIDVSSLLEVAGDTIEELDSPAGHELLALLRRPFDREIERRAAGAVQQ